MITEKHSPGFSTLTKDRFEIAGKTVAIVGGIVSAIMLIVTLHLGTEQRALELRWNQARLAAELTDKMFSDPELFNALRMIDWDHRSYQIEKGQMELIGSQEVKHALDVTNNQNLSLRDVYIRESFDTLFRHMGKVERAVKSQLVNLEDVRSPMQYYIPSMQSKYGEVLIPYMQQLKHNDAIALLNRFK